MSLEEQLHDEMMSLYRRTGEATSYWPSYFLRSVKRDGGLAVAKKLLAPGQASSGFDRLAEARRADLSIEYLATRTVFRELFTEEEIAEAERRLKKLPATAFPHMREAWSGMPEEVATFREGAVSRILVNHYERDPRARAACIAFHGSRCAVCDVCFEERYGEVGQGFIHVHHKRPISAGTGKQTIDPQKDLIPVCPNCHAMLHRRDPPMDVEQLRRCLR